ncbi:MAG TPA: WD40 repeat domain-containing protein, partial [Gemmataceae bacterium]|nr:WD40 repeat domain-containing protein [Gemmataceae bacterium]
LPVKLPAGIATAGAAPNVAVSADGKTLAFLSEGSDRAQVGAVRVWDVETGKELWRRVGARWLAPGHDDCILCVTPSPDGKTLALRRRFRDKDGQPGRTDIEFWDVRKGEKVRTLTQQAPTGRVISSPDGKVFAELLGGGRGGPGGGPGIEPVLSLRLVDQENGRELGRINQAPWALPVFSPDGKTLAVRLAGGRLQLYEARTGKPLHQALDAKGVGSVAFTPDGKQLLGLFVQVGGAERVESPGFLVWDVATGRRVRDIGRPRKEIETNTWVGGSLAVSPDGTLAAFGGGDPSTVRLLDLKEGKEHPLPRGHTSGVSTIAFARDGKSITTYNYEGAYTWDAESGKLMARLRLPATDGEDFHHYSGGYDLSPDGSLFAALAGKRDLDTWEDKTGEIVLWDTRSGKEKKRIKSEPFGLDSGTFYFSADGKTLASPRYGALNQGKGVRLQLYDVATGKERLTLKLPAAPPRALRARLPSRIRPELVLSPDGGRVTVECGDGTLRVWDAADGRELLNRPLPKGSDPRWGGLYPVAFSPDGRTLALLGDDGGVTLFEVATGQVRRRYSPKADNPGPAFAMRGGGFGGLAYSIAVSGLAFSPDGRQLAVVASPFSGVVLLDATTGRELGRRAGHRSPIVAFAFSPDGRRLVTGSEDTTGLVWDISRLRPEAPAPRALSPEALGRLWADLRGEDAEKAYDAIRELTAAPRVAVALLKGRLKPAVPLDLKRVERLLGQLGDPQFKVRDLASRELLQFDERLVPLLDKALAAKPPLEMKKRLEDLRGMLTGTMVLRGEGLRAVRAVEVLERIGTREARQLLQVLAEGAPGALLTTSARVALTR